MRSAVIRAWQAEMAAGRTSSVEIVARSLEQIRRKDSGDDGLHAVLEVNRSAREDAVTLDAERSKGRIRGPLHGIPVILKANIDTADGMTTTAGSLALQGHRAARDAFLVTRLRQAGAVVLAKANLSEWANFRGHRSISGWSSMGGQTRHPQDLRRSPCGSSSGSAVAVAAGYCPVSVGTETDGSIVCPAHACGVVGIKPTLGLVSRTGIIPIAHSQDTAGPMAGSVEDATLLLEALAGRDDTDPLTSTLPDEYCLDLASGLSRDALRGARIGVARDSFGRHPKVDSLVEGCLELMKELGAQIVDPARIETAGQWRESELEVLLYEFKHDLNAYLHEHRSSVPVHSLEEIIAFNRSHVDRIMPYFGQELMEQAQGKGSLEDRAYLEALAANHRLTRAEGIDATLEKFALDALVAPTGAPAWLIDHVLGDFVLGGCSSAPAVAGYPHITVPAGTVAGLPVGLSFFSTAWQEAKLIRFAYAFEQAMNRTS